MSTYSRPLARRPRHDAKRINSALTPRTEPHSALANWAKWQMPSLFQEDTATKSMDLAVEPNEPILPTPEELEVARQRQLAQEVEQIKRQAYEEAYLHGLESGLSAGQKQGYSEGQATGHAEAKAIHEALISERLALLDSMATHASNQYQSLENDVAHHIVNLATHVARHILCHELQTPTQSTFEIIKRVLAEHDHEQDRLRFWLHPDDLNALQETLEALPTLGRVQLLSDETISPGGVRAQTVHGDIDATIEMRWRAAIGALGQQT